MRAGGTGYLPRSLDWLVDRAKQRRRKARANARRRISKCMPKKRIRTLERYRSGRCYLKGVR